MVPFILHVYHLGLALGLDSEMNIDLTLYCVMRSEIYALLATIMLTYLSYEILRSVTRKSCIEIGYPSPSTNVLNATVVSLNLVHVINSTIVSIIILLTVMLYPVVNRWLCCYYIPVLLILIILNVLDY